MFGRQVLAFGSQNFRIYLTLKSVKINRKYHKGKLIFSILFDLPLNDMLRLNIVHRFKLHLLNIFYKIIK